MYSSILLLQGRSFGYGSIVLSLWGNITTAVGARDLQDDTVIKPGERQHESSVRGLNHGMKLRVNFCQFRRSTKFEGRETAVHDTDLCGIQVHPSLVSIVRAIPLVHSTVVVEIREI